MSSSLYYLITKILFISVDIIGICLILWVYFSGKNRKENKYFTFMTLSLLIWISFGYFANIDNTHLRALTWTKIAASGGLLFLLSSYHFILEFLNKAKSFFSFKSKHIITIVGLILIAITSLSNLFFKDVLHTQYGFLPKTGDFWIIFNIFVLLMGFLVFTIAIKKFLIFSREKRIRMQYFLIGFSLFIISNIIFNTILPAFYKSYHLYQFGNYSAIFLLGFTALAIVKERLFGIKVVLTQLLVGAMGILLFVNMVGSEGTFEYLWKGGLFAAFLVFGWLLVKSVMREIRQREKLDRLAKELEKVNVRLEGANVKLKKLDKAKSEFLSMASHQLRTPISIIKGYVSMIIEGSYGKISKDVLVEMKKVFKSNERLNKLINTLLNISRIEAGKIKFEPSIISIEKLISELVNEFAPKARKKNLGLKFEKPPSLRSGQAVKIPKIKADEQKLREVIANLIDNAIKYTTNGYVKITIDVKSQKLNVKSLVIKVQDTGAGLTKQEIGKLFQTFSRAEAGKRLDTQGTGLGLYVAKQFINMHKGKIWVESPGKGKGSVFCVELPMK